MTGQRAGTLGLCWTWGGEDIGKESRIKTHNAYQPCLSSSLVSLSSPLLCALFSVTFELLYSTLVNHGCFLNVLYSFINIYCSIDSLVLGVSLLL